MSFKKGLLLLLSFGCSIIALAQASLSSDNLSNVNIDDLSDAQIKQYYQKAQNSGMTDNSIFVTLQEKGLPETEIQKLKDRITGMSNVDSFKTKADSDSGTLKKTDRNFNRNTYQVPMQRVKTDLSVFGSNLFDEKSLVFEPNLRIATPAGYILGPDDELIINVFGFSERTYNVTVSPEGSVYLPQIGPVFVNGLSMEQASSKIKSKMAATIYKAIRNGQTQVQISLGHIRSIRVTVIGEAKKPGTFTVSSLTTLFNVLYLCGGPSDLGSYRNIELIRGNEIKRKVDLYSFLLKGEQKDNILLREGDVIRIPYYTNRVILNGNVKQKGKYEVQDNETFKDVLGFCGGFSDSAYKAAVTVYQFTDQERKIANISKSEYATYHPQSSDSFVIGKLLNRFENRLTIKGAVMRPGEYALTDGMTVKDLIEQAGGVKEDIYILRGSISRFNENRTLFQLSFNVDSVLHGLSRVSLKKDDSVTLYSITDLQTEKTVQIDGQVKKPGAFKWRENMTAKDLVLSAGGYTEFANTRNIEVARVIKNAKVTKANYVQSEIFNVDLSDSSKNDMVLSPFDVVIVKALPGYNLQRTVYVEGMVLSPGLYALHTSGDRITDLLARVGGFKENADSSNIIIRRVVDKTKPVQEREEMLSKLLNIKQDSLLANDRIRNEIFKNYDKISIDLTEVLRDPGCADNMVLEEGDIITVERNSNVVKVSGEVYFPTIIPFQKRAGVKYYVQKSGNFMSLARRNNVLVIYADGRASKTKRILFFRKYPKVTAHSEILVPVKTKTNRTRISLGEWALILSALGTLTSLAYTIKK